ncbi:sacsin N-terminal ATP-binding-like domain-containing protein [Haloglomus litoreum]|uniref:sacsin N-terminal ATP-binding-like domain-containing protein n=1 Tax=Haloglomus litoreum TaxID=3034026 RepID=UPI0023E8E29C|nr:DUF3883 domain-containing protein [Haloglomus sp. DT116]
MEAEEVIGDIRTQYIDETPPEVRESLSGHSDVVQMNFAASYFPLEFIQNADDEDGSSIRFQLREVDESPRLEILNDGNPFTDPSVTGTPAGAKSDVRGICKAGRSPKQPRNHIGFIGVGFKSIFEISDRVEIHSGDFHFEFSQSRTEAAATGDTELPWRVIPWWKEPTEAEQTPVQLDEVEYTTRFIIHLDEGRFEGSLEDSSVFNPLSEANLDRRVFLFLTSLQQIIVDDELSGSTRHLRRRTGDGEVSPALQQNIDEAKDLYPRTSDELGGLEPIRTVTVEEESTDSYEQDTWVLFSDRWTVPEAVQKDQTTKEYFRGGIESREIFIGLLADDDGTLISPGRSGTIHSGVFSYLPLKELNTDFEFLIHADFLTPADRQTIKRDVRWNREIGAAVADCLKAVIETVGAHDDWWRHLDLLMPGAEGDNFIETTIQNPVRTFFKSESLVRDAAGNRITIDRVLRATQAVVDIFSIDEFQNIKDNLPLHPEHDSIYESVHPTSSPVDIRSILTDNRAPEVLQQMGQDDDAPATFASIYRSACDIPNYRQSSTFRQTGILLEDGRVVGTNNAENLYRLVGDRSFELTQDPLPAVEEELSVVNRRVLEDDENGEITELFNEIGVPEITNAEIVNIWLQHTSWSDIPTADRVPVARICKRGIADGDLEGDEITGLKLRACDTEEPTWHDPDELLLPEAYNPVDPGHAIEGMSTGWLSTISNEKRQALFTEGGLPIMDGTLRFVDPVYLDDEQDTESADSWRQFLYAIGVDALVRDDEYKKKFAGCLGELYVESQLSGDGTTDTENVKVGRDIQTTSDMLGTPNRIIEVKSTAASENSFSLSIAQTKVLANNQQKYWVYSVTDVFTNPKITRAKGSEILTAGETKIQVGSSNWASISEPVYR